MFVIIITNVFIKGIKVMIENLKEQIQLEAKHQIITNGYSKTTIRSVANACKIGVGTMYNYFRSKDELITSFMLDDWKKTMKEMEEARCEDSKEFLRGVQVALDKFISKYESLFSDKDAIRAFASVFSERHIQLRERIADIIQPICAFSETGDERFLAEHIAESVIHWSMEKIDFEKQYTIIQKLL